MTAINHVNIVPVLLFCTDYKLAVPVYDSSEDLGNGKERLQNDSWGGSGLHSDRCAKVFFFLS